jgi:hypothetical protein
VADRRGAGAAGQDEVLQRLQVVVEAVEFVLEVLHLFGGDHLHAGDAHLAAQVEEVVLHVDEQLAHFIGHLLAQQDADGGVGFIHFAQGVDAQAVLGHPVAVAEAGGAGVAGAGVNLGQAVAHGCSLFSWYVLGAGIIASGSGQG